MICRKLMLAPLLCLMLVPIGVQAKSTARLSEPLAIDGLFNDWLQYPRAYLEDIGTSYGVVNDDEFLYILVQRQGAIGPGGNQVRIWLNADGKKKKTFGFLLQGRHQQMEMRQGQQDQNREQMQQRQQTQDRMGGLSLGEGLYMLQGEDSSPVQVCCEDGTPIQIQTSSLDNGVCFYELRIPLNGAPEQGVMFTMEPGQNFRIGFEAMPKMSGPGEGGMGGRPGGGRGGAPPGGGGGMGGAPPGGGTGGGPGGGGPGGGPGMGGGGSMEAKTVWVKYKLAEQDD